MTEPRRPPHGTAVPLWLPRAWRIRAVMLILLFGLVALLIFSRLQLAARALPSATGAPSPPENLNGLWLLLGWLLASGLAIGADWLWLQRNHHRVNAWGLSKGRSARNRPS